MPQSDIGIWLQFALQQMAAESYLNGVTPSNNAALITRLKLREKDGVASCNHTL